MVRGKFPGVPSFEATREEKNRMGKSRNRRSISRTISLVSGKLCKKEERSFPVTRITIILSRLARRSGSTAAYVRGGCIDWTGREAKNSVNPCGTKYPAVYIGYPGIGDR